MKIVNLSTIQILDSRGNPTLQVGVVLDDGSKGIFSVPSGASTGIHEAHELRDCDENLFHGKSVFKAIKNIENISSKLIDKEFSQKQLDDYLVELDGTENKENLGANAILGISIAFSRACAKFHNLPLTEYLYRIANNISLSNKTLNNKTHPHLFANVINGGLHSGNALNIQEFMIIPKVDNVSKSIEMISEIYQSLKEIISEDFSKSDTAVGDEGGFAPNVSKANEVFELLTKAIEVNGYSGQVAFAIDAAASDFMVDGNLYEVEKGLKLDYKQLTDYYNELSTKYPIISIEDPFGEDDFEAWAYYMQNIVKLDDKNPLTGNNEILVVGDDLLVTNIKRLEIAKTQNLCNSLLLKINQIGSLTESILAHNMAKESGWHTIVSHRSGETTDDFISDLSVALSSSIKLGAPARGERVAKYNRLLNIFNN